MTDQTEDNQVATIRAIVEVAITSLCTVGFESREEAAALLAVQAIVRVESREKLREIAELAADFGSPSDEGRGHLN